MTKSSEHARRNDRVKVFGRVNRAIATNVGGDGSSHSVSATQTVRIRQDETGTRETVESVKRSVPPEKSSKPTESHEEIDQ